MYTLGKNSMFIIANESREVFTVKGGARGRGAAGAGGRGAAGAGGRGAAGAWGVASRNRLGLVRSRRGFQRVQGSQSTRTFQDRT